MYKNIILTLYDDYMVHRDQEGDRLIIKGAMYNRLGKQESGL